MPYVGFAPTTPHNAAGWRIDPPVSEPSASGANPAATAAAVTVVGPAASALAKGTDDSGAPDASTDRLVAYVKDAKTGRISILSGAHLTLFPRVRDLMREAGADDILLVAGGVIPDEDVPVLRDMGVADVILQDAPPDSIVTRIRDLVAARPAS